MTFNTIIVDDAKYIRIELKKMLEKYSEINVIGEASNGRDAIEIINNLKPNVVFLDISLPIFSGLEVLRKVEINFEIIFISSYSKYLPETQDFNAIGFLMKPISTEKLNKTLKKLKNKIETIT